MAHPFGEIPEQKDSHGLTPAEEAALIAKFKRGNPRNPQESTTLSRIALPYVVPPGVSLEGIRKIVKDLGYSDEVPDA